MSATAEQAARYQAIVEATGRLKRVRKDESGFRIAFARCESPIEQAFCLALFQVERVWAIPGEFEPWVIPQIREFNPSPTILVYAQQPISRYRVDFLLVGFSPQKAEPVFVIVECDGKEFHSTPEQLRRDKFRQGALAATGFKMIRHSGSDIFSQPQMVVERTLEPFGWKVPIIHEVLLKHAFKALEVASYEINPSGTIGNDIGKTGNAAG